MKQHVRARFLAGGAGFLILAGAASAAESRWRLEAEGKDVRHIPAVTVVEAADASAGKALLVPSKDVTGWSVVTCGFPAAATPGSYRVLLRLKLDQAADLGKGWRIEIRQDKTVIGYGIAYGLAFAAGQGWQDFAVDCLWTDPAKRPAITMRWSGKEGEPELLLDAVDVVRTGDLPPVRITKVFPDRIRYLATQHGTVAVSLENLTAAPQQGEVRLELQHDLEPAENLGIQPFQLPAGGSATVEFAFKNSGKLYGYGVRAILRLDGRELAPVEEFFTVHDNPWATATGARDEEPAERIQNWWGTFYSIGATDAKIQEGADCARREYVTCFEFFSWSPGECFDMVPDKEFWIRGNGGNLLRGKRELQREVAALKRHGIGCITYIAYQAMGEKTVELLRAKPEWFIYSKDSGDVLEFYTVNELTKRKKFWEQFDWAQYQAKGNPTAPGWKDSPEAWTAYEDFWKKPITECLKLSVIGYFCPNYKLPEVVDYCADQAIDSAKMFGWDGLRWDCGNLNTGPVWGSFAPYMDFYGKPLAATPEEMVDQTVANLKRLKARIRREFPNYVIGTNYGSWMETHQYPKLTAELARDGNWLLDEFSYGYNQPMSPYHFWDKYYAVMADEGEYVTSLGGHYNPFAFNRNGGKYPVDRLYEGIFRLAGKGHPSSLYYNSCLPAGNFAQFSVRFGRFVFDPNIRRVEKPEESISVVASAPLWWEKSVGRLKDKSGDYRIVHLINPPVAKEVETDPMSRLPRPVENVAVAMTLPDGKLPKAAFALSAEAWRRGEPPKTQAVALEMKTSGNQVTVTVPQVLYWKVVVFRFE